MGFQWLSDFDSKTFMSCSSAIKNNEGLFKSKSQSNYFIENIKQWDFNKTKNPISLTVPFVDKYGFEIEDGQYIVFLYGSHDFGTTTFAFVFDVYGIIKKMKLKSKKGLFTPEIQWERDSNTKLVDLKSESDKRPDIQDGKFTIAGKVISIKVEPNQYSYYGENVTKMLIETISKNRLYGTAPKAIADIIEPGDTVEFKAIVKAKEEHFGFFSRPKDAKITEKELK